MADTLPTPWHLLHSEDRALTLIRPEVDRSGRGLVFSVPHSGRYYPDSFIAQARQSGTSLRISEDAFVDTMLNLSPDHLDRHGDMTGYVRAKREIFADAPQPR